MSKKDPASTMTSDSEIDEFLQSSSDETVSTPKREGGVRKMVTTPTPPEEVVVSTDDESEIGNVVSSSSSQDKRLIVGGEDHLYLHPPSLKFCWVCHYENAKFHCQTCPRSFHPECMKNFNKGKNKNVERCQECSVSNVTAFPKWKNLTNEKLALLLTACCENGIAWLNRESTDGKKKRQVAAIMKNARQMEELCLVKVVSMKTIQESISSGHFRTLEGFAGEMKWLYHNSVIFNGRSDDFTTLVGRFLTSVFSDLNKRVWDCVECQLHKATKDRPSGFFMTPCQIPHPVIWGRLAGFPHWPAKIISSNSNDGSLNVFFFGDYTHANLKLVNCCTFSTIHPSHKGRNHKLTAAIKEANDFLKILEKNPMIGPQIVEENSEPLSNLTEKYIKNKIFPQIHPSLLREMLHPTSTSFELDK